MAEVWYLRGEGGAVDAMQLPLGEGIAARLRSGALQRVNEDGSPWTGLEPAPTDPPADDDPDDADPDDADPDGDDPDGDDPDGDEPPAGDEPPPATLAEKLAAEALAEQATRRIPRPRPDDSARKPEWVAYAVSTGTITEQAANELTKIELIARFGGPRV